MKHEASATAARARDDAARQVIAEALMLRTLFGFDARKLNISNPRNRQIRFLVKRGLLRDYVLYMDSTSVTLTTRCDDTHIRIEGPLVARAFALVWDGMAHEKLVYRPYRGAGDAEPDAALVRVAMRTLAGVMGKAPDSFSVISARF